MDYQQAVAFLYDQLPIFQKEGKIAFKPGLDNTYKLIEFFDIPIDTMKFVHLAGTNGKGSTSHVMHSILKECGYKTGLYTSPHLKNFTERIKIDGAEVDQNFVVHFVERAKPIIKEIQPSFFELTFVMGLVYFYAQGVDLAIIETGMGGRLDATNVVNPLVSVITNIGRDHEQYLGNTLAKIAGEKAGIIKPNVPVVIGETNFETLPVFRAKARECGSEIFQVAEVYGTYESELKGPHAQKNIQTALEALAVLKYQGWNLPKDKVEKGIREVTSNTNFKGRWQILRTKPLVIADTGHNEHAIRANVKALKALKKTIHVILGFVSDKDVKSILELFPRSASFTFVTPNIPRAMSADQIGEKADKLGLHYVKIHSVNEAIASVIDRCENNSVIYIGGSTFVVAEIDTL